MSPEQLQQLRKLEIWLPPPVCDRRCPCQSHTTDERKQATAAIDAAKNVGVKHFVWSTLPDVEVISGGKFNVPHFTGKAKIDRVVQEAGFANHT